MPDLRRISLVACLLIVALRMAIGWQFFYEGLWKFKSQRTATPWTSEGYLRNAQGPFRKVFLKMTGDPDDDRWLKYDWVSARWNGWRHNFDLHYPDLTPEQEQQLSDLLDGPAEFSVPLAKLPDGMEIKGAAAKAVRFDDKAGKLIVKREPRLIPKERDDLLKQVADNDSEDAKVFRKAVEDLYRKQAKLSYRERLAVSLKGDPNRVGTFLEDQKGTVDYHRRGEIDNYRELRARYDQLVEQAKQDFQRKHLERTQSELLEKRAAVVGPVKALDKQLRADAWKILTPQQMQLGATDPPPDQIDRINQATIWSLLILGGMLLMGLLTRPAALVSAAMVFLFYLPMPPWPGVPEVPGAVEHSLIVNKNLIEVLALLAIAFMPTGQWFGVDRWFQKLFYGPREDD